MNDRLKSVMIQCRVLGVLVGDKTLENCDDHTMQP